MSELPTRQGENPAQRFGQRWQRFVLFRRAKGSPTDVKGWRLKAGAKKEKDQGQKEFTLAPSPDGARDFHGSRVLHRA